MPILLAGIFQAVPDAFESVWNFFYAGKLFMGFLVALSILSITVIIFKALDLRRRLVLPEGAVDAIERAPAAIGQAEAEAISGRLSANDSALGRLGLLALSGEHVDKEDASRSVEATAREEIVELESGVALLEVVITIAPLLGLLGTVSGLVNVFSNLGDTADHAAIAVGIAEALNTTIAGLAIAVPTVIAHSYFMKKIERMGVRMEILLGRFLSQIYRQDSVPEIVESRQPVEPEPVFEIPPEPQYEAQPETQFEIQPELEEQPIPQVPAQPAPQIHTAIPDPGQEIYTPPEVPAPTPEVDPSFPRLLAGQSPGEPITDPQALEQPVQEFAPEPAPPSQSIDPDDDSQPQQV